MVLESGVAATSLSWGKVQPKLGSFFQVWSSDRAGLGWSESTKAPRDLKQVLEEFHKLLDAGGVPRPFIIVGHSFGGLLARHFVARYPEEVLGVVFVDPLDPCEWQPLSERNRYRLSRGVFLSRWGGVLAGLGVVRFALDLLVRGARAVPKAIAKASSGRGASVPERLVGEVRKLPEETWPMVKMHWCQPKSFFAMAKYLAQIPLACAAPIDDNKLAEKPLVVISGAHHAPEVLEGHRRLAGASVRGQHWMADGSGHWVQLDRPDLVVQAVEQVAAQAIH